MSDTTTTPGLTHTQEGPVSAAVRLDADQPPSALWQALVDSEPFERALVDAVRTLLAGVPHHDRARTLRDAGVAAGEGGYARLLVGLERAPETDAYQRALDETARFGQGEPAPFGQSPGLDALPDGPLAALDAAGVVPTVAIHVGESFRDRRRDQRERVCQLIAALGQACDVRVVATGLTARWLAETHGAQLPRSFSEQCRAGRETHATTDEKIAAARERFDPEGRAADLCRTLADEPAETLSYHELVATTEVSRARVSQVLGDLEDAGLVEKYGPQASRKVDLLPAGAAFVNWLDSEIGRQRRLDEPFSDTGQNAHSDVYSRPRGRGAAEDRRPDQPGEAAAETPYRTRYADRPEHAGAAAAASAGDIVAVEGQLPDLDGGHGRHTRLVSYDHRRDEAVVAVQASTPLQYMTSVAIALASPRFLDEALPPERLEDIDEPTALLRQVRCIGALSDAAANDGATFRDALVEWGEDLAELTTKLNHEDYEDRAQFCGEILRAAHGLAGTIVHLLDAAGVDVVRELRVPRLNDHQATQLARTVAISTAIQSQYGAFAAYRQLFEDDEQNRQTVPNPEIDATDPLGNLIGSIVLRGSGAHRLGQHVEGQLAEPVPLHEDAPEFAVSVTVATPDRAATTAAAARMLEPKGLRATPEAVSMLEALAEDLYAVADALSALDSEAEPRTVRLDEVRFALCHLDAGRLLADALPSLSKAVAALLATDAPLSQSELADAAGISTRSLRRHLDGLLALDIVRETDAGYRIALPRPDDEERGQSILPTPLDTDADVQSTVFDLVLGLVDADEAGRLGDPDDPLGAPFFGPRLELAALRRALPRAGPYLQLALSLCGAPSASGQTIQVGPEIEQASLQESATGPSATAADCPHSNV